MFTIHFAFIFCFVNFAVKIEGNYFVLPMQTNRIIA